MSYTFLATAAFGLEGVAANELKRMDIPARAENGGARFEGSLLDAYKANLCLRTADRVLMVLAEEKVNTFEDLFQLVSRIAWERLLTKDASIHVSGKCVRSRLMSVRDCQSISKKAIVQRLMQKLHVSRLPETGVTYPIDIAIVNDLCRITLDMSGDALNRRGYRTWNGEAPLRETLAAALILQSGWHPWQRLYDPCCGTGTLLVEAAFIALGRAPGLTRPFAMEAWPCVPHEELRRIRTEAKVKYEETSKREIRIAGSDIDPEAIELARRHVKQAGLAGRIELEVKDLRDVTLAGDPGVFICNPPYGERLDNIRAAHAVARQLGRLQERHYQWSLCAFTADMGFEREYGRRAARRRRYYNGRIECEYHIFESLEEEKKKRVAASENKQRNHKPGMRGGKK